MIRRRSLISISGELPTTYQQVEYIESSGTQYIDTLVPMNADDYGIYIDFYQGDMGSSRNWYYHFGSGKATSPYNGLKAEYNMAGKAYRGAIMSTDGDPSSDSFYSPWQIHASRNVISANYLNSGQMLWINNDRTWNSPASGQSSSNGGYNIYLFCVNFGGNAGYYHRMKLYECKISKGSQIIRNFIPCYRISDNVVGLYDLCTKQFFTNSGTGAFLAGVDIYSYGNEETDITGGWSSYTVSGRNTPTLTKNADNLYIYGAGSDAAGGFYAANKIDFTNYSKLKIKATTSYGSSSYTRLNVVLTDTLPTSANPENSPITNIGLTQGTNVITELNVASITGSHYLALHCNAYRSVSSYIYEVWLEK